ncbi:MAG: hypothetical protein M5U28_05260 [Sandaracinaceae bacterium]|nr:hypothetical protein [Sandaracinaceae bacterium]
MRAVTVEPPAARAALRALELFAPERRGPRDPAARRARAAQPSEEA